MDIYAIYSDPFPAWFMIMLSIVGLGFYLLIICALLVSNLEQCVLHFFIGYSVLLFVFVGIRSVVLR